MKELYQMLSSLPPELYTVVAVLTGILLMDGLNSNEKKALGAFFIMIGEVMWVTASQEDLLISRSQADKVTGMEQEIQNIKNQMGMY